MKSVVKKIVLIQLLQKYADRQGGYTRVNQNWSSQR